MTSIAQPVHLSICLFVHVFQLAWFSQGRAILWPSTAAAAAAGSGEPEEGDLVAGRYCCLPFVVSLVVVAAAASAIGAANCYLFSFPLAFRGPKRQPLNQKTREGSRTRAHPRGLFVSRDRMSPALPLWRQKAGWPRTRPAVWSREPPGPIS